MQQRMMGGSAKPVSIEILGLDFEQIDSLAEKVKKFLENTKMSYSWPASR